MPAPFAWIDIPDKGFTVAKYPVTNAQFTKFIEAGGYSERRWWTDAGWEAKLKGWEWDRKRSKVSETGHPWVQPLDWSSDKENSGKHPVVGVSWYECIAFCNWLSDSSGETITLLTEDQWQYAAQGDDGRGYTWGKEWDGTCCNSSVFPSDSHGTTPVQQYEGKGDSPFGVVDMIGNVWENCLTDYDTNTNDSTTNAQIRVLRGGSWTEENKGSFRCDLRMGQRSVVRIYDVGFRLARL